MTRPRIALLAALLILFGVWVDQRLQRIPVGSADGESTPAADRTAAWIWAPGDAAAKSPTAFALVRTFRVGSELLGHRAILRIAAEPAARVYCNGAEIVTLARPLDSSQVAVTELDLTQALHVGSNRLYVETGSVTGSGGIWLQLDLVEPRDDDRIGDHPDDESDQGGESVPVVRTDDRWHTVRHPAEGIRDGWRPVRFAEPAHVWGPPGIGRWPDPRDLTTEQWLWSPPTRAAQVIAARTIEAILVDLPGDAPGSRTQRRGWRVAFEPNSASGELRLTFDPPNVVADLVWPEDEENLGEDAHLLRLSPERRPPHPIRPLAGVWRAMRSRAVSSVVVLGPRPIAADVIRAPTRDLSAP